MTTSILFFTAVLTGSTRDEPACNMESSGLLQQPQAGKAW